MHWHRRPRLAVAPEESSLVPHPQAALKQDMRCPVTGAPLKNMPAVKAHVARREYAEGVRALAGDADIIERWPGHN